VFHNKASPYDDKSIAKQIAAIFVTIAVVFRVAILFIAQCKSGFCADSYYPRQCVFAKQ